MKVAVYSSCGNNGESQFMSPYRFVPTRADVWDEISQMYPEHEFKVYVSLHGGTFIDEDGTNILLESKNVPYTVIPLSYGVEEISEMIASDKPDVAIALTTPCIPYDWCSVRDSLIAEKLRERGIRTIAHSTMVSEEAFEKHKINKRLKELGFKVPNGVFINKGLFDANFENTGITRNAYRDFIEQSIKKLNFPVVIKCDCGAGSVGLSVAKDVKEAIDILDSDRSGMDMIVEERVNGINFGAEIYGTDGSYSFKGPVIFSSNEDGVTDPFESVKFGPVRSEYYKVEELKSEIHRLAEALQFSGGVQIDLMFTGTDWYIIEINPRFSLMSMLIAAIENRNIFLNYLEPAFNPVKDLPASEQKLAIDFKTSVFDEKSISDICRDFKSIKTAMRFKFELTDRNIQYTEIAVGGFDDPESLLNELNEMHRKYPEVVTEKNILNVKNIVEKKENV